ncbi:MAG: 30S ribosomal protein S7 [Patescibacteria group bacterium]
MRRKTKKKLKIEPDPVYNSELAAKFINNMMWDGKKSVAREAFYGALEEVKKIAKTEEPLAIFEGAVKNVSPSLEVRSRRIGGANYQVPREVRRERATALAIRWILNAARSGKGAPVSKKLAKELVLAFKNEGAAVKKKDDTHKMAEANRAFAHFTW